MLQRLIFALFPLMLLMACQVEKPDDLPSGEKETRVNHPEHTSTQPKPEAVTKHLLIQLQEKAKQGMLPGLESFPLGTRVHTVLSKLGKPEAGDPSFLDYKSRCQCGFVAKDTQVISGILSYDEKYTALTTDEIMKQFGKPNVTEKKDTLQAGDSSLVYQLGKYQLSFFYQGKKIQSIYLE